MEPCLISGETDLHELNKYSANDLKFKIVTDNDGWLAAAYGLLSAEFEVDVLDPFERYVEWLELNGRGEHKFPFLMVVAYLETPGCPIAVGVISGNIMQIEHLAVEGAANDTPDYMFAIGHQVTTNHLRSIGFHGVGTKLWSFAAETADRMITQRDGTFIYSFLEAETSSVGFWSKLGYRWPEGVDYWQPPLEFDSDGNFLHREVPEILMLRPMQEAMPAKIDVSLLRNLIATAYYNWCLDKYKKSLSPGAFENARKYVMDTVFGRFSRSIPSADPVKLVLYKSENG